MRLLRYARYYLLLTLMVPVLVAAPLTQAAPRPDRRGPNAIVVKLQPNTDVRLFASMHGLEVPADTIDTLPGLALYRFTIKDGSSASQKLASLARSTQIVYAEPDIEGQIPEARQRSSWVVGGDDYAYAAQWAGADIRLDDAHTINTGANIVVAILDTGIDTSHPMLKDRLVDGYDFVDNDSDPQEEGTAGVDAAFGHGTHVAGLVALAAPGARIMPLRTLRPDGSGDIWTQVRAVRYALAHGADVVNLSYSFEQPSQALDEILGLVTCVANVLADCRTLVRPGVVVVAAAGNSGMRLREYPAAAQQPGILGVGANTAANTLASFSTYGAWVQVTAPGEHILSTIPGGGYASWSGTSMAAPLVAGVAAMVRAAYPSLRPNEVVSRITTTGFQTNNVVRRRLDAAAALGLAALKDSK